MIRAVIILFFALVSAFSSQAQLCPGGGVNFSSAIMFDPAWIYGCATGSSCNGGVALDNRPACEPTIAMDACAPLPSCGVPGNMASDVWFKFYPTYSAVTISCIQNTSFVLGVQAFDGAACGSLTEIGCALAGGPSSGVQLTLSGLQMGKLYYFRIFGSSHTTPQRTGLYCFCGTTGLQATILPASLESLKATVKGKKVQLSFDRPTQDDDGTYEIEHSSDGISFRQVYRLANGNAGSGKIVFMHSPENNITNYYRLKRSTANGQYQFSTVAKVSLTENAVQFSHSPSANEILLEVFKSTTVTISDMSGRTLKRIVLAPGAHRIPTTTLSSGLYLVHNNEDDQVYKFVISK